MEAWLAELEKEIESASTLLINNPYHQNETMETSFNEQLGATLGDNFPNPCPLSSGSNNTSPHWDFDCNNVIKHFTSSPNIFIEKDIIQDVIVDNENYIINENNNYNHNNNNNNNYNNNNNNNNNIDSSNNNVNVNVNLKKRKQSKAKVDTKKNQGGTKRKRQPSQVQDHIIAERKRRELLRHMFISLSAIVPGLKKMDKTSVLGETIKYMKQLQEKVKALEEVANNRRVMVVKNSPLIMDTDDTDSSSTVDDNCPSGNCEIEVKISGNTLLLKVCCEDQKGILAKLFAELDKHDLLSVSNCSVIQLGSLGLDITIVAQIKERCFVDNIKGFIKSLRSGLGFSS